MKGIPSQINTDFSVGLLGAGAVGSYYGSFLARFGVSVTVLTRFPEQYDSDIAIESDNQLVSFRPNKILSIHEANDQSFDVLIVASKVLESIDFVSLVRPFLSDQTVIFLIQNGIFIEDVYVDHFHQPILRGLAFLCAVRESYQRIRHLEFGLLTYGVFRGDHHHPNIQLLGEILQQSEMDVSFSNHIYMDIWEKLLWNAPFNPLSVLYRMTTDELLASVEITDRIYRIMEEVCVASDAFGCSLSLDLIEKKLSITRKMNSYKTSMYIDFENNRPLEIEAILGNYVRFCTQKGIDIPYSQELYQQLKDLKL